MTSVPTLNIPYSALGSSAGLEFGPSSWREVTQETINAFARLTGDDNPIHVDAAFAAESPFGTRIAHGLLTLSLVIPHLRDIFHVEGSGLNLNYGLNRLRFPAPVPSGSRIRASGRVDDVTDLGTGFQLVVPLTFEVEGGSKPVCVAEFVFRYYA